MTVLPELERALLATARERSVAHVAPRRRVSSGAIRRGLAVAATGLLATGTALAATGVWNPLVGDKTPYGPPSISASQVPAAELAQFGVLRRAPTTVDHGAAVQDTLSWVSTRFVTGVHPGDVRYLASLPDGAATILVPAATEHVGDRVVARASGGEALLCVVFPREQFSWLGVFHESPPVCFDPGDIAGAKAYGGGRTAAGMQTFGLAPDGVARATVHYADGSTQTASVANNFFTVTRPAVNPQTGDPRFEVAAVTFR